MLVVLLGDLARAHVVLDDLLVRHAGEEDVLLVWVELDAVRDLAVRERLQALSCGGRRCESARRRAVSGGGAGVPVSVSQSFI